MLRVLPTASLSITLAAISGFSVVATAQNAPTLPVSRHLQDIPVFLDKKSSQATTATGGATLAADPDRTLPVDLSQPYDKLPSLRLEAGGDPAGTWSVVFAANDWRTFDLSPYLAKGALEFNIRGTTGSETFGVSLMGRRPGKFLPSSPVSLAKYVTVTQDWQRVVIPLRDLVANNPDFPVHDILHLTLTSEKGGSLSVRLNNLRFTSPDLEPDASTLIKLNQVGYLPGAKKMALVSGEPGSPRMKEGASFSVLLTGTRKAVLTGKIALVTERDTVSGEAVYGADFSLLKTPGRYVLRVNGFGDSPEFRIGTEIYTPLVRDALRYFYLQRSGMPLEAKYAGAFKRGEGHPQDRALRYLSDPDNAAHTRDVHGGWYDAGDYGKYSSMAAKPINDLLWAYELFPGEFADGMENTPESGNKIPDILDEVRWETDWMMRMQDAKSGGFYQKVWPNNASVTPDKDTQTRYVYDKVGDTGNIRPTGATANASAALAHAASVWRLFDTAYADKLLAAARKGWAYLEANPQNIVARGMTGAIEDDRPMRQWAAGELYRATGEAKYGNYFLAHYAESKFWEGQFEIGYVGHEEVLGWLAYLKTTKTDSKALDWIKPRFTKWQGWMNDRQKSLAWKNYLNEWNYFWGSNSVMIDTIFVKTAFNRLLGGNDTAVVTGARDGLNYLLGTNPLAFSYVSGYGSRSVKRIYSCIWTNDGLDAIPTGYLAGGANKYEGHFFSNFAGKCYRDSAFEWTTNENAIYWNSALVLLSALVDSTRNE